MIVQSYSHYFWLMVPSVLASAYGIAFILFLLAAVVVRFSLAARGPSLASSASIALFLAAVGVFVLGIYSVEYEFDLSLDRLTQLKEHPDDKDCGSAWTGWWSTGSGYVNRCPKGCYRGITLRQKMEMHSFPPWPETNRELKCWYRNADQQLLSANPDKRPLLSDVNGNTASPAGE